MKNLKSLLIIGILCVVAFWVGLYAFRTQKPSAPPPKVSAEKGQAGQVGLKEINFTQVKEGVKLWELKAEAVDYQQQKNLITFKKVTLIYFPKGEQPITLVGNLGNLDTQTKNVLLEGEVVISTPDGYELKAPSLYYQEDKRVVSSDGKIFFKGPNIFLDGEGMIMSLDTQKVWVKKKARMTFYKSFFKS